MISYTMIPDEEIYGVLAELSYKKSASYKKRKKKLLALCLMSLVLIAMSFMGTALSDGKDMYWLAFLIMGIFTFLYGFYMVFFGAKKQMLNAVRQKNQKTGDTELIYTLGEDIRVHSEKTDARIAWELIEDTGEISHFIYLWCSGAAILLDKNRLSGEELAELSRLLKNAG